MYHNSLSSSLIYTLNLQTIVALFTLIVAVMADVESHAKVTHGHGHGGYSHAVKHLPKHKVIPHYGFTIKKPTTTTKTAPTTTTVSPAPKPTPKYTPTTTKKPPTPRYKTIPPYKPALIYQPTPLYTPAPIYHQPAYKRPVYDTQAKYNFEWEVVDDYSKLNFGQREDRDGYATTGEYRVLLPDCRTQIVKYNTADGYSGNVVEVLYEGTPCVESYKPNYSPARPYHA